MSLTTLGALLLPDWLRAWLRYQLFPALGLQPQQLALGVARGMVDTALLVMLGVGSLVGSHVYMRDAYALTPAQQETVLRWAPVADYVARRADIPPTVPLVLWFKESSLQAVNPANCIGLMGTYDLVRSGDHPCFTPGPVGDVDIAYQMSLAAREFKKRCPAIRYETASPDTLQRCYLAYNAGIGAAATADPTQSAYVMNGYSAAHQNMVYRDVELGTVRMRALGAWPAHLAIQSLVITHQDRETGMRPYPFLDTSSRVYDRALYRLTRLSDWLLEREEALASPPLQVWGDHALHPADDECLVSPPAGNPLLRPSRNPVTEAPLLTQHVHGCSYGLPGIDISSSNATALLQAPLPGEVTTYTDQWHNTTIRIENDEWIVWLLHPRSYLVAEGTVSRGEAVGVMGAVGYATGPHVHYSIYSKVVDGFVNPLDLLPK